MNLDTAIAAAESASTIVTRDRLAVLYELAHSAVPGEFWECGVYRGGTAKLLAEFNRRLRLFDTFTGMPPVAHVDWHQAGDFGDTSCEEVRQKLKGCRARVSIYQGWIPDTFPHHAVHDPIAFAHIDVDIYASVKACCWHIWPRLAIDGVLLFDDYGFTTCPGAKLAVDEFCKEHDLQLELPGTGQAIVRKT